ncbi:hypothetical protein [Pyxidicoccus xibeiensis]|uniref:hypothetical protein n=1 Tax=Pyxidicoccus xibeiensis TaxID=2906759 RepID=UPI0020A7FB79|nr:hypothetical protein [Pyxidicoccus xibeiensis]MCP3138267.1 hypothetical protein [Pyxidicoccus xibeiensis]
MSDTPSRMRPGRQLTGHHPYEWSIILSVRTSLNQRFAGAVVAGAVALLGCGGDIPEKAAHAGDTGDAPSIESASASLGASCVLGDGYVIASGSSKTLYPVSCPSDCYDFPDGGLDLALFCKDGVLGENDPLLTGGTVGPPFRDASTFNGYSRCSVIPTALWAQSADRKTCVRR